MQITLAVSEELKTWTVIVDRKNALLLEYYLKK